MTAISAAPDPAVHDRPSAAGTTSAPIAEPAEGSALAERAVEVARWGMPIVRVDAMRDAFFRDAGARYNDIVFWSKPSDWRNQLAMPRASTYYVYFNFNTRDGPVVLELPASNGAGLFGTLLDAWQAPLVDVGPSGVDEGRGAKYLLLPPGHRGAVPDGVVAVRPPTYNGFALFRAVPASATEEDVMDAIALVKRLRLYPLARAGNPPPQRFVDMADRLLDGIVRCDPTFYARLARMVGEEPVQPNDQSMMRHLRALGIEQGKTFAPDADVRAALADAIDAVHDELRRALTDELQPWWPGSQWALAERAPAYFHPFAPAVRPDAATLLLLAVRDAEGELLRGGAGYTLRIPANVPVERTWAVTAYDMRTAGFIRESASVGLDAQSERMERNVDGSLDIHFGPTAPSGRRGNWIYTAPGRAWFATFRFEGPTAPLLEQRWTLPDIAPR